MPVDASDFVSEGAPDFSKMIGVMISSLILAVAAGVVHFTQSAGELFSSIVQAPYNFAAELIGSVAGSPVESIAESWTFAADVFPVAGPLDFTFGVFVIVTTIAVAWQVWNGVVRAIS